jgi:NAD-dependent deacetylase
VSRKVIKGDIPDDIINTVASAHNIVVFSGAGISAESGIPTFRDKGGLWDRFDPAEVGTPNGLVSLMMNHPERVFDFLKESFDTIKNAHPNEGHIAIAELENLKLSKTVITQNIDNLHIEAGNTNVIELHGNLYRFKCTKCGRREKYSKSQFFELADRILSQKGFNLENILANVPRCACGGIMRIDVVLFGEPVQDMERAYEEAAEADVMLVVGTSGVVYPAASIPVVAKRAGAKIIEINPSVSGFGEIIDWWIEGTSARILKNLLEKVKRII